MIRKRTITIRKAVFLRGMAQSLWELVKRDASMLASGILTRENCKERPKFLTLATISSLTAFSLTVFVKALAYTYGQVRANTKVPIWMVFVRHQTNSQEVRWFGKWAKSSMCLRVHSTRKVNAPLELLMASKSTKIELCAKERMLNVKFIKTFRSKFTDQF